MNSFNIKIGDFLSETQYYKVKDVKDDNGLSIYTLENERGLTIDVTEDVVLDGMFSSDHFDSEQKVSLTELEHVFTNAGDKIFKVIYHKQLKVEDLYDEITKLKSIQDISKSLLKDSIKGELRELVGYRIGDANFGRSNVIDLSIQLDTSKSYDNRLRLVDHRCLISLTLNGIKYTVK